MSKQIEHYFSTEKPSEVRFALAILWASFTFGIAVSLLSLYSIFINNVLVVLLPILVVYGCYGYLISSISKGKNWARICLLVFVSIGTCYVIFNFSNYFGGSIYQNIQDTILFVQEFLQIAALTALFTANSNPWFD